MFSEDIVIVAKLAITVGKLIRKIEKLLVDPELQLQPTRGLVSEPLLPNTLEFYNREKLKKI